MGREIACCPERGAGGVDGQEILENEGATFQGGI